VLFHFQQAITVNVVLIQIVTKVLNVAVEDVQMHPVANVLSIQIVVSKAQNVTQANVPTHLMANAVSIQNVQAAVVLQENVSNPVRMGFFTLNFYYVILPSVERN